MRIKRARTLVVAFSGNAPVIRNFMTQHEAPADGFALDLLSRAEEWQAPEAFSALYPSVSPEIMDSYLRGMTDQNWLVVEGTPQAEEDAEYENAWSWSAMAGLYHFGIQDPPWLNQDQSAQWMQHLATAKPPIALLATHDGLENVTPLERPDLQKGLMASLARRRSIRSFTSEPVSLDVLRDCLFAGMGVTGFLDTQIQGEAPHVPLKMTPSGGGRNPYEAYVYASNVSGLAPGLYHYSALDHSLALIDPAPTVTTTELFAQQDWTESAAFGILLVAHFERTMWKYPHPNAYRVVLMESGHIAQNILLTAANHGLAAAPTGAASDRASQALLSLNRIRQSLVYAVFAGHLDPDASELANLSAHPA